MGDSSLREYVEGVAADGKALERLSDSQLQELHKQAMHERVRLSRRLHEEVEALRKLQDELTTTNEKLEAKKREEGELRQQSSLSLSLESQGRIARLAEDVIDQFISKPRTRAEETNVDVRFLPGAETTGLNMHIGGEGSGSLDARFKVRLDEKVDSLAVQAAKYWGLDADKVFFLDRDSRIVPGSMLLSEIILPPVHRGHGGSSSSAGFWRQAAGSGAGPGAAGALAEYGGGTGAAQLRAEAAELYPVLEGRNYTLTLVRAGTVLSKEDLSKPKGDEWNDFTFEQARLEEELVHTRKKHGDVDAVAGVVNMDEIPSLYDLIHDGQIRKMRKRWDTRCRVLEFLMFLLCEGLFFYLISPDNRFNLRMYLITQGIERSYLDTRAFKRIKTPNEYAAYLDGPLKNAIVLPAMNASNLFVLGATGYLYRGQNDAVQADWCTASAPVPAPKVANGTNRSNATNQSTANASGRAASRRMSDLDGEATPAEESQWRAPRAPYARADLRFLQQAPSASNASNASSLSPAAKTCVASRLQSCLNSRVVRILDAAEADGHSMPACRPQYAPTEVESWLRSFDLRSEFSYAKGTVASYGTGERRNINFASSSDYFASIGEFRNDAAADGTIQYVAKLLVIFVYAPSLNGMIIFQLLTENTLSGTILTSATNYILDLDRADSSTWVVWSVTVVLSFCCLLMEIRRIFGCPQRFFYEKERDKCSYWTLTYLALPMLLLTAYGLTIVKEEMDGDATLRLSEADVLTQKTMTDLYKLKVIGEVVLGIKLITIILLNLCLFRYLLMYFPQLQFMSAMVLKLAKPLLFTLLFLFLAFLVFGMFLYSLFSSKFYEYRSGVATSVAMLQLLMGGAKNWLPLYQTSPAMWTFVIFFFFVIITLFLRNVAGAIMFSHEKEKALFENYNYHVFWSNEKSKRAKRGLDTKDFNPATVGWDFSRSVRDPKELQDGPKAS